MSQFLRGQWGRDSSVGPDSRILQPGIEGTTTLLAGQSDPA